MKRAKILLTTGLLLAMLTSVQAQHGKRVYVHIAPPKPKAVHVVKSKKMHRDAIWVAGHWKWNGKNAKSLEKGIIRLTKALSVH